MAILDGPPAFILLGFIMALGAYLRQVGNAWQKELDELEGGGVPSYPFGEGANDIKDRRIAHLKGARHAVGVVTNFVLFPMLVLLAFRTITLTASVVLAGWNSADADERARGVFDGLFVIALTLVILAMWVLHLVYRAREKSLRADASAVRSGR